MRSATLHMVSCVLMFLILHHTKGNFNLVALSIIFLNLFPHHHLTHSCEFGIYKTIELEAGVVCDFTDQLPGKCGNDGRNNCVNALQKKALFPEKKIRCECFDHPTVILGRKKHICKCRQDC